jgi:hypothetical protein
VHAQYQDRKVWEKPFQFVQPLQPTASRHREIQHHYVPPVFLGLLKQLRDIRCFTDHSTGKLIGEDLAQAPAQVGVVVCK